MFGKGDGDSSLSTPLLLELNLEHHYLSKPPLTFSLILKRLLSRVCPPRTHLSSPVYCTAAVARQQIMPAYSCLYLKHIRQSMNRLFICTQVKRDEAFGQLTASFKMISTVSLTTGRTARALDV